VNPGGEPAVTESTALPEPSERAALTQLVRSALTLGLPLLSVITFVAVAIKVFRASHMETSTTVAVVGAADVVLLLKGVVLSLLPGFLAGLIAIAVWLWSSGFPRNSCTPETARRLLRAPEAVALWSLLVVGFFTVPFFAYVLILLPVLFAVVALISRGVFKRETSASIGLWASIVPATSLVVALGSVLYLALSPEVWLPVRQIDIVPGSTISIGTATYSKHVSAYVLDEDKDTISLLIEHPRAVVSVPRTAIEPRPAICIPPPGSLRWLLLRTSQRVGLEGDYPSPYPHCLNPA
jgi:hypothetical protein